MFLLWLIGAYLLGSIPFGYLIAQKAKNIDIRTVGSGNIGTANITRTLGPKFGALVLFLDAFKGFLPVLLSFWLPQPFWPIDRPLLTVLMAAAAVLGHSKSIWLKFYGGKAAATGLGTLLGMAFPIALMAGAVFIITVWYSRLISLGSMLAAISVPLFMLLFYQPLPYYAYATALAIFILIRHRSNIGRIRQGTEPKFIFRHEQE